MISPMGRVTVGQAFFLKKPLPKTLRGGEQLQAAHSSAVSGRHFPIYREMRRAVFLGEGLLF